MAGSAASVVAPEATASARVVIELIAVLERAGVARERFLEAAQLDPAVLELPDGRLLRDEIFACMEVALDITGDPALGIHWAQRLTANSYTVTTQLIGQAATLRDAFAILLQFGALVSDEMPIILVERGAQAELRFAGVACDSLRLRRMTCELAMLGMFRMLRDVAPTGRILHVDCPYPAPDYRTEYTRVFGGSERFDQPVARLVFERALLDQPSRHHDPEVQSQLRGLAERRIAELREQVAYAVRVRELLLGEPAPYRVPMSAVARRLELSLRSLHRRLGSEGRSYAAIANEASATVAKRLLTEQRRTIQETSFAMGFANVSSFHRAFKRWTGITPTQLRGPLPKRQRA